MNVYEKIDKYKAAIDIIRPFEGEMLKQIRDYYRIGLTYTSNALEGNSLTEIETKILLEDGLTVGGKPLRDTFEAIGHAEAYDFMFTLLQNRNITESNLLTMHKMFYKGIDDKYAGCYRDKEVFISGSKYSVCKVENIKAETEKLFVWIDNKRDSMHPVEFAALLHKKFVFIHPFIDGNGRISRLIMNTVLIQDGYMMAIIPPILRHDYISLLEQAHKTDRPFIEFIAERVLETERDVMQLLHITSPK